MQKPNPNNGQGKRGRPPARIRLSESEFAALTLLLPRVTADRLKLARLHLVDGMAQSAIAEQHHCTRQNVNGAVRLVLKASMVLDAANKLVGKP